MQRIPSTKIPMFHVKHLSLFKAVCGDDYVDGSWILDWQEAGMSVSGWETECCFSVFNKFLSCYWNGFTWNMVELVGSRVNCLRVLFLLCELPGIRVGLLIACFTWNINWSFKLSHTSKPQNPTNTSKQIISIPTPSRFTWNTKPQQPIGEGNAP